MNRQQTGGRPGRWRPFAALSALLVGTLLLVACLSVEARATVDLSVLAGVWEGTHVFLDYQDDATRVELPTRLVITLNDKSTTGGPAIAELEFLYREPGGAFVTEEAILRYFPADQLIEYGGNWAITASESDPQTGFLRLVFTGKGEDDDRPALVRQTIERLGDALTLRKEVRYDEARDFILRNEYRLRQVQ